MKIRDIAKHQEILKFLAKDKKPFEAYVEKVDKKELVFQVDKTIQMSVEIDDYDKSIKKGAMVAIDVESGVITLVTANVARPETNLPKASPTRGCANRNELAQARNGY